MDNPDPDSVMDDPDSSDLLRVAMGFPVTASLGPQGPLLRQLGSLTTLPNGVAKEEIRSLTKYLEGLCISLVEQSEAEEPSLTAKCWMGEVRELCYDTKNYLDEITTCSDPQLEFMLLEARAKHASERRLRYEIHQDNISKAKFMSAGRRRLPVLHPQLIDRGRMDTLANMLGTAEEKPLKVVSLLGLEGAGKTTLAKRLYHQTGGQFQCRAFVRVSPNPEMRMFLTMIYTQIHRQQPNCRLDAQGLITSIFNRLCGKRYLIIIDDLWSTSVWDIIKRAFPDDGNGSRIITTTQIHGVASACSSYEPDYLFQIEPFMDDQSQKLFFGMVFGSEDKSGCSEDFAEVADEIIRKCGGLPLLTVNVASLLPTPNEINNLQQWMDIRDSLPPTLRRDPTTEGMEQVVNFVYKNLSPELNTCLLYFSMYPEGYTVNKHDLVKQWVAEGFTGDGPNKDENAGEYFDELVSRGMIQAVDINHGEVVSCTLHHMVQDLVLKKSMEENFIITVDCIKSPIGLAERAHRLSVHFGGTRSARIPDSIVVSEVRSLAFFGFYGCAHFIDDYKLLRVLTLDVWADDDKDCFDLTAIGELLSLRYLKIACNITVKLPDEIQALQYLETLEVDATVTAIPSGIGGLGRLTSLKIAVKVLSRTDICILQAVRALSALSLDVSSEPVEIILFEKGGFSVLKYFKIRCSVPLLKFEAGSMPDLQKLSLCFNAEEADQLDTATIIIEHLPGLKEITAEIWGANTFRTATVISNHPSNPGIYVQLADGIFQGEDEKKQAADSSLSMLNWSKRMSTLHGLGDAKRHKLKVQTDNTEVKAQTFTGGLEDMANRISKLKIKIDDEKLENYNSLKDMDLQLSLSLSPMNKWPHEMPYQEINLASSSDLSIFIPRSYTSPGCSSRFPDSASEATFKGSVQDENTKADIRIQMQPDSTRLLFPAGFREDAPGMNSILSESQRSTDVHTGQQTQGPASLGTCLQLQNSPATCTSRFEHGISSAKVCSFPGCSRGSRGSSGCCISHGGGRRCQKVGCSKGAEGRTIFCKAHGGGRRCEHLGCTKSAEGGTDFCISHDGGRRCIHEDCTKAARGKSGRCLKHGGGKRCQQESCTQSAEGKSGLCIAHGGGRRCQYPDCAQGSTAFCEAHGGGERCTYPCCTKGAEGSTPFCKRHRGVKRCSSHGCVVSVHGGAKYCIAHGRGRRCVVEGCSKSARGCTDHCVRHGGGKRCRHDGCGKSAQGSTVFCKAHGGGKRCSWGNQGSRCDRFARGKNGMCASHESLLRGDGSIANSAIHTREHTSDTVGKEAPPCHVPEGQVHGKSFGEESIDNTEASSSAPSLLNLLRL